MGVMWSPKGLVYLVGTMDVRDEFHGHMTSLKNAQHHWASSVLNILDDRKKVKYL